MYELSWDSQRGFVRGRSCLVDSVEFSEEVPKEIDEHMALDNAYLNVDNSFDKVRNCRQI